MAWIEVTITDGIADVVLNRPKVNAMSKAFLEELGSVFESLTQNPAVQGILVRSAVRSFSAGLDLKEVASFDRAQTEDFLKLFRSGIGPVFACPKPVAMAVQGHAIAGGLVLALCADFLAFQEGSYKVGLTELMVGVPFPREAFEIVRAGMEGRALRKLIYGAGLLEPAEAYELGIGDALVPDAESVARFWLTMVCSRPLKTFEIAKRQIRSEAMARIEATTAQEREEMVEALFSPAVRDALKMALG